MSFLENLKSVLIHAIEFLNWFVTCFKAIFLGISFFAKPSSGLSYDITSRV